MKRKGRPSASKAEEKSENGVEDPQETNGDVAEEPEEKKRKLGGRQRQSKKDEKKSKIDEEEENEESENENESEKKKKKRTSGKITKKTDESVEENTDEDDNSGAKKRKKSSVKGKGNKKNGKSNDKDNEEDSSVDEEKKKSTHGKKTKDESTKEEEEDEEEEDDDAEYEVEKIVDEKVVKGVKYYLIRWKGYSSDTDTWEPVDTLDCPSLIAEFKKGRKKKKKSEKSTTKAEESWDENEDFEVDKVLDVHFRRDGKREFLVSWKGYPQSQSSWEPEENMNCVDLIEKFMLKVEKAKETNDKELRVNRKHTDRFTLTMGQAGRRLSKRQTGKQRVQYHEVE